MTPAWHRSAALGLWALVGAAKTMALVLLLTAPDTRLLDIGGWLALAFGLAALAVMVRSGSPA